VCRLAQMDGSKVMLLIGVCNADVNARLVHKTNTHALNVLEKQHGVLKLAVLHHHPALHMPSSILLTINSHYSTPQEELNLNTDLILSKIPLLIY